MSTTRSATYELTKKGNVAMQKALLCIDLINDLVHPDGNLVSRGYADFEKEHQVLHRIQRIQEQFRQLDLMLVHARTCFTENYFELNQKSPLLGDIKSKQALVRHTWGTEFADMAAPIKGSEPIITKHRLSAFHRTRLDIILSSQKIEHLFICGSGSHNAIESTVRDAHDRDFAVTVFSDACLARTEEEHAAAMLSMKDFAHVGTFDEVALELTR